MKIWLVLFAIILSSHSAYAFEWSSVKSLKCSYDSGASFDGENAEIVSSPFGDTSIVYDSIDVVNKSVRAIGNAGADDGIILDATDTLDIVGLTNTGNPILVSIMPPKSEKFTVVQSRHMILFGAAIFSQSYGTCASWD